MKKLKMIPMVLITLFALQGCSEDNSSTKENPNEPSQVFMTANIDGIQFNNLQPSAFLAFGYDVFVHDNNAPELDFLWIQGDNNIALNNPNFRQINLHIPEVKWAVGTYDLYQRYSLSEGIECQGSLGLPYGEPSVSITSGTLTITEFNLTTKRIKGTFSFSYKEYDSSTIHQVTNGTFNYGLDANYFN